MESMSRATWTDERLDDFARNTDRRFDEVVQRMDSGFNRVDADIRQLRSDMDARFEAQQQRFDSIDTRLHALQRTMVQTTIGMSAVVVTALIAVAG